MRREATAVWTGGLKDGKGSLTTPSGVLRSTPYSFGMRFENTPGTNPEELIAAAHAGCFSMALSGQLGEAGLTPERIETRAAVTLEKTDAGWTVTRSALTLKVRVPGAERAKVQAAADGAKAGCPISRLLNAKVTLETTIET
ncbi:MAG: OsmC family protein [Candidatus Eisenbacteria bacterium]|nr:OsmC family protein [Candidatus Eisenbacteria bacterium]